MNSFRAAWLIALNDLRRRSRDRTIYMMALIAPLILAVIIGAAFGREISVDTRIGVVDLDGSVVSTQILANMEAALGVPSPADAQVSPSGDASVDTSAGTSGDPPVDSNSGPASPITIEVVSSEEAARAAMSADQLDGAVVIPSGFGDAIATDEPEEIGVIVDAKKTISADVVRTVALSITASVDQHRMSNAAAGGVPSGGAPPGGVVITTREVTAMYAPVTYFAPSMAILFMFLTLGSGARSMIIERDEGTLARLRSMPIPTGSILAGKVAGVMVVGLGTMAVMWLVTTAFFGAKWGDPLAVVMVAVATVISVAGISFLISGLARTDAQADGWVSMVAFVLALLGGNFVQPGMSPDVLSSLSLVTPNGWALRAFTDIGAAGAGPRDVILTVVVLMAMGIGSAVVGLVGLKAKIGEVSA